MMNNWKEQRNQLAEVIKEISDQHGGDDPIWLADYTLEVVKAYRFELEIPIACFEGLRVKNSITIQRDDPMLK